ncbi:MAG: YihY family inner membrane protein [Kiritimatiellae bacterium]|nr:YihY family inner membrane protein [Kiritimatiellia bacterium]MDW8458914.1 YhjD/YihY/BrkB family envelope integrity protein [Verrucomicrobiota bacterium]
MIAGRSNLRARLRSIFDLDAWPAEISTLKGLKGLAIRLIRIGQLVVRGFREDDLAIHAAALTFSTLLALVPLLTLAFAILKGFGGAEEAMDRIADAVASMPAQFREFVLITTDLVLRANLRTLGWIGVAVLFVTAVQTLGSIEASFNRIWGVSESRSLWRKFTNYTSVVVAVPVLIMAGFAVSASLKTQFLSSALAVEGRHLLAVLMPAAPLATAWFAFFLLFIFMPNTHVRRRAAAAGALVTALLWLGWQRLYISMQVSLSRYDAVYGAFASIPIFLIWLYVGWMIILLGAEIAFAFQHHATYPLERIAARASVQARLALAISLLVEAARALRGERETVDLAAYAADRQVPIRLVNEVAAQLARVGLLAERADAPGSVVLLRDPDRLTVGSVVERLLEDGAAPESLRPERLDSATSAALADLRRRLVSAMDDQTLSVLVERAI